MGVTIICRGTFISAQRDDDIQRRSGRLLTVFSAGDGVADHILEQRAEDAVNCTAEVPRVGFAPPPGASLLTVLSRTIAGSRPTPSSPGPR
jgi:hypothetical protein